MSTRTPDPTRLGWLPWENYLRVLRLDVTRLREVAGMGLAPQVPSCPGWSVGDLLEHLAFVYLHKVAWIRQGGAPQPWPPAELEARDPLELFDEAVAALWDELTSRDPSEVSGSWWPPDQTVGFWYRRMALETAVHRVDAELAHDVVTPVDAAAALDGVDEVLRVMLAGPREPADGGEPLAAPVRVSSGGRCWTVRWIENAIDVHAAEAGPVPAEVAGRPEDVFLWLWGRRDDRPLAVSGDPALVAALRREVQSVM